MQIVIDIPEEIYSYVNTQWRDIPKDDSPISIICNAIIDGTPLEAQTSDECLVELKKELENRRDSYNYYGNEYEAACYQSFDTAVDMVDDTINRVKSELKTSSIKLRGRDGRW